MKKLLFAAVAVFTFGAANAQEETSSFGFSKGDVFAEGSLKFGSTNDKNSDVKTSTFGFTPKVGYFLTDDMAAGIQLGVGSSKVKTSGTTTNDLSSFSVGAFGRYYFLDLGQRFKTYTEFALDYSSDKDKLGNVKYNSIGAGLGLGMNYFIKDNFAISYGLSNLLSFKSEKSDISGDKGSSSFGGNINEFNNFFSAGQFGLLYKF